MDHTKIKPGKTTFTVMSNLPDDAPHQVEIDMQPGVLYIITGLFMVENAMCVNWRDDANDTRCLPVNKLDQYVRWHYLEAPDVVEGDRFQLNTKGIASQSSYVRLDMTPGKTYTVDAVYTSTISWYDDKDMLHNVRKDTFHEHFQIITPALELDLDKPLQTKAGRGFTLLSRDGRGHFPLIGQLDDCDHYTSFTELGSCGTGDAGDDLMNIPEVISVTRFAGAGYVDGEFTFMGFFDTPERARESGASSIKEITVDLTEK